MDGFDKNNELGGSLDQAAQNLSQAADDAASAMTGEVHKPTSYEEIYGRVEPETAANENQQPFVDVQFSYDSEGEDNQANGMQIASLVLGIISIVCSCCSCLGIPLGIAGLILGIIGNKQGKNGIGTAGIVCSIVGLVLCGLLLLVSLGLSALGDSITDPYEFYEWMENYNM